jgi:hypothetical protein
MDRTISIADAKQARSDGEPACAGRGVAAAPVPKVPRPAATTPVWVMAAVAAPTVPHPGPCFAAAEVCRLGRASAFDQGKVPIDEVAVINAHTRMLIHAGVTSNVTIRPVRSVGGDSTHRKSRASLLPRQNTRQRTPYPINRGVVQQTLARDQLLDRARSFEEHAAI